MVNRTSPLAKAFWSGSEAACPVIDMHGHMGHWKGFWFPRPTPEGMLHSMDRAGVRMLCFASHAALFSPEAGHTEAIRAVRAHPDRLRAYLAINPHYPDQLKRDLEQFDKYSDVFVGIKLLASYHKVPITDARYEAALKFANERRLLTLSHTWGGSAHDGADAVRKVARTYPDMAFLLGHSLHGAWGEAIAIAKEFPRVYLELCAVLDRDRPTIEKFVEAGLADRMLFGTDLPWFTPLAGIGAILSADITDDDRHRILHGNAEKLLEPLLKGASP